LRLLAQGVEQLLGVGDDRRVALGVAERDQLDRLIDIVLDALVAVDRAFEPGALAQDRLRGGRIVPQLRVFGLGVQLGQAAVGDVPVKDASSAAPTTF
jgi:hypothetical protein